MQLQFLHQLAERIAGKESAALIDLFYKKKDVNEFRIAKKLGLTINKTRNLLYKLSGCDILYFRRKKDSRRGWYIYFWTLNIVKALELLLKLKQEELQQTKQLLKSRRNKNFFVCKNCEIELTEEGALTREFTCPECGKLLELCKEEKKVKELTNKIKQCEKNIEMIKNEIRKEEEKIARKEARKARKEEGEKKRKRKKRRKKARKKIKVKPVKKKQKKLIKKRPAKKKAKKAKKKK